MFSARGKKLRTNAMLVHGLTYPMRYTLGLGFVSFSTLSSNSSGVTSDSMTGISDKLSSQSDSAEVDVVCVCLVGVNPPNKENGRN